MVDFLREVGLEFPDPVATLRIALRLTVAALLGALVGLERQRRGRAAGLRTHMLVALGAALFTVVPTQAMPGQVQLGEIAKGLAAGVGFLGAGTILKREQRGVIQGLTTAANIWLTAAIGFAAGAGWFLPAILGTAFAIVTLLLVAILEGPKPRENPSED